MTLAYVFWHWTNTPTGPYLETQRAFHAALAAHPSAGFHGSDSAAVENAPWIPGGAGFEDRYFIADFAALGTLNDAAVEGATFLESLRPAFEKPGVSLWQRQLVLGPTPEFCLRTSSALPDLTAAATVPFRRVLYHP